MSCVAPTINSSTSTVLSVTTIKENMTSGTITQATGSVPMPVNATTTPISSSSASATTQNSILNKQRLQDLVREVDPNEQLDDDVEEAKSDIVLCLREQKGSILLLQIADDFIENVVTTSCLLAKHRKSSTLEVKDVQLSLEKNWNMWIPGFGSEELRPYKKSTTTEAHKQRMALIRKVLKKY